MLENPYKKKNEWYFCNEAEEEYGPFFNEDAAKQQLKLYIECLEGDHLPKGETKNV